MTDIASILTFPSISNGFTALRPSIRDSHDTSPSLQLFKVPRLVADSDSGSASRSRAVVQPASQSHVVAARDPVRVRISGNLRTCRCPSGQHRILISNQYHFPASPHTQHQITQSLSLLRKSVRIILTRDAQDALPATYERIYALCRDAVVVYNQGEALAKIVVIELEKCVALLERKLADDILDGVGFASSLSGAFTWFEKQVGLLEDVMTYLDRGYLVQTKGAQGIQFAPPSLQFHSLTCL